MGLKVLLTVDLHSAGSKARAVFDDKMKEKEWKKITSVSTTYEVSFKDSAKEAGVLKTTKDDVSSAAQSAGISNYDAVCMISGSAAIKF
jgi:hypothetical protein